jgi:prevent-host-death family protein
VQVNVHEAKTQLSRLIAAAEKGEEVVIARDGRPAVRLVPCPPQESRRTPGTATVIIADDFDELPEDIAAAFRGELP